MRADGRGMLPYELGSELDLLHESLHLLVCAGVVRMQLYGSNPHNAARTDASSLVIGIHAGGAATGGKFISSARVTRQDRRWATHPCSRSLGKPGQWNHQETEVQILEEEHRPHHTVRSGPLAVRIWCG